MTKSDQIRDLAKQGIEVAEIARRLNIRYQHAYNVLKRRIVPTVKSGWPKNEAKEKPPLKVITLTRSEFQFAGRWIVSAKGALVCDRPLPKEIGVYAFAKDGIVLYVGVATMGLSKRLYFYSKPGSTQRTSQRIHAEIRKALEFVPYVDIYTACPPDIEWNGLPIHGSAGLELGLIKMFSLPWNMRSAR